MESSKANKTNMTGLNNPEIDALIDKAAKKAAKEAVAEYEHNHYDALKDVGLGDETAEEDIKELRSLLDDLRMGRRVICQTFLRVMTTALLMALMLGVTIKLKLFGE